ncbi:hypothetical protein [Rhodococcus jostii]|uniref:Lantibiotic dehydratase, C terminus n=1 Tax=Rhodococcus jostii TaxID=132919 RepID=A0ABU4CD74_RHOJO|nr:hypothetical protein [Rhodococcus jostii]MDV6281495.1 hypothetical protein [Rhodococcus jostii]
MSNAWSYDEWQRQLETDFITSVSSDSTISFFVDSDELRKLYGAAQVDPAESLTRAVASQLELGSESNLFVRLRRRLARWKLDSSPSAPPVLPLLVLSVLAATELQWDTQVASNAYYPRLAELFARVGVRVELAHLRHSFDDVPLMWEVVDQWVEGNPDVVARLSLRNHPYYRRIGYSLSQAVIRGSDRARLTSFFDAIDLDPTQMPDPDHLLRALQLWTTRERGFTKRFVVTVHSETAGQMIVPTLMQLASAWDGRVLATNGRRWLPIRLSLDLEEWSAGWVIRAQEGLKEDRLELENGARVDISWPEYGPLYELDGDMPSVSKTIANRFKAAGHESLALHSPKSVHVLGYDDRAACWVECGGVEPYEEHVLVVAKSRQREVEQILHAGAERGSRIVNQRPDAPLIPQWVIYRDVVFADSDAFSRAIDGKDRTLTNDLRPDHAPVPRLANGLPLKISLAGRHHYLQGGEPDLVLPMGEKSRTVAVSLDGSSQTFRTSDFPIPLRATEPLPVGRHVLEIEGRRLEFHIHAGMPELGRAGAIRDESELRSWTDELRTPVKATPRSLPRGGHAEMWTIDYTGVASRVVVPEIPAWLAESGLPTPRRFEPKTCERDVWFIRVSGNSVLGVTRIGTRSPDFRELDPKSHHLWTLILRTQTGSADPLMTNYLRAWKKWSSR